MRPPCTALRYPAPRDRERVPWAGAIGRHAPLDVAVCCAVTPGMIWMTRMTSHRRRLPPQPEPRLRSRSGRQLERRRRICPVRDRARCAPGPALDPRAATRLTTGKPGWLEPGGWPRNAPTKLGLVGTPLGSTERSRCRQVPGIARRALRLLPEPCVPRLRLTLASRDMRSVWRNSAQYIPRVHPDSSIKDQIKSGFGRLPRRAVGRGGLG